MMAKALKALFDTYIELDIRVWENFYNLGEVNSYPKGFVLKNSHATEKHLNIVLNGSGGNLIWKKNNFVCIDIASKNEFLCDYMSFTSQTASPIEVKLFEDSTIFRLPYQNFLQTLATGNHGEMITRIIAERSFIEKQQQQIDLLTKSAKERYVELLKGNEKIGQIPLKYLASYLGITPQSLSRIRAGKIKKLS